MYDSSKIITGIIIFTGLLTFPFWFALGKENFTPKPDLNTPAIQQLTEKECIEDTEFMISNHMKLLNDWRTTVVREGKSVYVAGDGEEYDMSLQKTCLECHSNKQQFCDQCHTYSKVEPDCWDCHIGGE